MKRILFFEAPWCHACHDPALVAALEEAERAGVVVERFNVDERLVLDEYRVSGLPSLIFKLDGKPVDRVTGAGQATIARIREFVGG